MSAVRPQPDDFPDAYRSMLDAVPDGDVVRTLDQQREELYAFLRGLTEDVGWTRYAEDKWSLREVVGHVIDTERMFGARALAFARGGPEAMPGFDGELWSTNSDHDERTLASLSNELRDLRASHVAFFEFLPSEGWDRRGSVEGQPFTPRAVAWFLVGHAAHHVQVIRDRYL